MIVFIKLLKLKWNPFSCNYFLQLDENYSVIEFEQLKINKALKLIIKKNCLMDVHDDCVLF